MGTFSTRRSTRGHGRLAVALLLATLAATVITGAAESAAPKFRPPTVSGPRSSTSRKFVFKFGRSSGIRHAPFLRFRCSIDSLRLAACKNPFRVKLKVGAHFLRVQGVASHDRRSSIRKVRIVVRSGPGSGTPGSGGGPGGGGSTGGGGGGSTGVGKTKSPTIRNATVSFSVPPKPASADIEIALDTTASMGPSLSTAQSEASSIVTQVQQVVPNSRFAFVQFQDTQFSSVPYRLEQPLTSNPALFQTALAKVAQPRTGVGGDPAEDYNFMFEQSLDPAIGWRSGSRKFLVVIGDAEPHGAGTDGVPGCTDTSPDPHGLHAPSVLAQLAAADRTVFMIRQPSAAASATLACYQSLAADAFTGSAAQDGLGALPQTIASLIAGTFSTIGTAAVQVTTASPSPATAQWVSIANPTVGPISAPNAVSFNATITVPAGTPHGTYSFKFSATADGAAIGSQTITVTV